jgi:hypothetical protein
MEAPDADSTENQVDRTSQQMEKMVPELPDNGILTTTVGEVRLIPAQNSEYITGTDRRSVVTRIFYAIKKV